MAGKTVLFGGTFNPPHFGHIEMAKAAAELPDTEKIIILPSRTPVHKNAGAELASAEHRVAMCKIAFSGIAKAEVSDFEISSPEENYTYLTVRRMKAEHPEKSFAFLIGGDSLVSLHSWYSYGKLVRMVPFYAVGRGGLNGWQISRAVREIESDGGRIEFLQREIPDISSSTIRKYIRNGVSIENLVPPRVKSYIEKNGIYT